MTTLELSPESVGEPVLEDLEQYKRPIMGFREVPALWHEPADLPEPLQAERDLEHYQEVMIVLVNGLRFYKFETVKPKVEDLYNRLEDDVRRATLAFAWLMAAERQGQSSGPLVDREAVNEV